MTEASIITTEQAKAYIGIKDADTSHDDTLAEWIDIVSRDIEGILEDKVKPQSVELICDGSGDVYQKLPYRIFALYGGTDAEKLANVQYRDSPDADWADLETVLAYIRVDPEHPFRLELLEGDTFTEGQKNIRIKYWAGYETVPGDIHKVCLEMVAQMWRESGRGDGALGKSSGSSTNSGGSTASQYVDLRPRWNEVLSRYKSYSHNVEMFR